MVFFKDDSSGEIFTYYNNDHKASRMDYKTILYICGGVFVALLLLGCCCRRRRNRGVVLSPAPVTVVTSTAPYPQQQYVVTGPVAYPPQQSASPWYPPGPAPAPAPGPHHNPPYPTSNYPYQAPYIQQPQAYSSAPSAPDANVFFGLAAPGWNPPALPPPYEQVCAKQPPYNTAAH